MRREGGAIPDVHCPPARAIPGFGPSVQWYKRRHVAATTGPSGRGWVRGFHSENPGRGGRARAFDRARGALSRPALQPAGSPGRRAVLVCRAPKRARQEASSKSVADVLRRLRAQGRDAQAERRQGVQGAPLRPPHRLLQAAPRSHRRHAREGQAESRPRRLPRHAHRRAQASNFPGSSRSTASSSGPG